MTRTAGTLLVLLAVLALPGAAAAETPDTLARTAALGDDAVRPGMRIDFVGVQWRGAREGAALRLRRAGRWGPWRALHASEQHAPGRNASELVAAAGATAYQVRLPAGASDGRATAIDSTRGQASPARASSRPCMLTRAQWGADESLRFDAAGNEIWAPEYFPVQKLTLHHTATEGAGPDPAALVRAIYRYHAVELGFGDIGYHLVVDANGCVYEGRHSGADGLPVYGFDLPDGTPQAVNGGHVTGFNAGNVGVAVLGDFTAQEPTGRARKGVVRAMAAVARRSRLDPLGSGTYVNPVTGATKTLPTIAGHRDWLATECPGEMLYPLLPAIRLEVARG